MQFASNHLASEARGYQYFHLFIYSYFAKAVSYVGTDPKSGKLWDSYVMFETSCVSYIILA